MRELLTVPNPQLRQESKPVDAIDGSVREIAEYMMSQLDPRKGVGFAAPQFGEMIRVITVRKDDLTTVVIINPEIVKEKGEQTRIEGCLCIPGKFYVVSRPKIIKVRGLNLQGEAITLKGHGLLATVLKHEIDHLNGVMIDQIGKLFRR